MKTAIELIADERQRQIEVEGWTKQHDLIHKDGERFAALCLFAPCTKFQVYYKC